MADETAGDREQRLNEVMAAYVQGAEAGQAPGRHELLARHPELAAELESFLDDYERLDRLARPLREAARAGAKAEAAGAVGSPGGTTTEGAGSSDLDPTRPLDASPDPPAEGARVHYFGDFELTGEIARGGMGVVYRARQLSLNRTVALKMILTGALASDDEVLRFRNEAEAAANLDHPSIVPIYEVGVHEGHSYFSMKLIEGGSLAERLPEYNADPRAAARLLAAVARAVHHAHQRGVLHRDLKPSNILVDRQGQPHVTDFGLAKRVDAGADAELTRSGAVVGSPPYMAPEQTTGRRGAVTTATDVYGLGAVLYATLTGRPPFRADSVLETIEQVRQREPEPPSGINHRVARDLQTVCLKCLDKDPQRRYASALELAEDLDRWLDGRPIAARRVGRAERAWRWARRNQVVAGLTAVVVLLTAASVVGLSISNVMIRREQGHTRAALKEAETRSRQARQAVDRMYTEVAEKWLAQQPRLEEIQLRFLQEALLFYQEFAREEGADPEIRLAAAEAGYRVGDIQQALGRPVEAEAAYRGAIAVLDRLPAGPRGDAGRRGRLASVCNNLAVLLLKAGRVEEGKGQLRRALDLFEGLASGEVKGVDYLDNLSRGYSNLGALLIDTGHPDEAPEAIRKAVAASRRRVASSPADHKARMTLALAYLNLGEAILRVDGAVPAEPELASGVDLLERVTADVPRDPQCRQWLARGLDKRAHALRCLGRYSEAEKDGRRALTLMERLTADFPATPTYAGELELIRCGLAWTLANRTDGAHRNPAEAVRLAEEAVAHVPKSGYNWNTLGMARYRAGLPDEAVAALGKSMEFGGGGDSFDWFFLAMAAWERGDAEQAREWAGRAARWMEQNRPKDEELRRFRRETEGLMSRPRQSADRRQER